MIHDSKSRSKRYYKDLSKPHIVLSRYDRKFFAADGLAGNKEDRKIIERFIRKLNRARAKS